MSLGDPSNRTARLDDAGHCPVCGGALSTPQCPTCGVDFAGPLGVRLWQVSQQAARLIDEREQLVAELRATARPVPVPQIPVPQVPVPPVRSPSLGPASLPGPPVPPGPPSLPGPSVPPRQPSPPNRSVASRIGVQGLLVALGALLVAVAGIVFLVFAWDRLSLGGRALVVAALTVSAMAGAAWLRPRLPETAEGIGGIAVALVLGDAWAIRATGLFGTDGWTATGYAAVAAAVSAAVLLGWGLVGGVRAGSVAGVVIAPLAPLLTGFDLAERVTGHYVPIAGLGLVAASALGAARIAMPSTWRAERGIAMWSSAGYWLLAVPLLATLGAASEWGAIGLVAAAATAVLQIWADRPAGPRQRQAVRSRDWWSFGAGAALTLVVLPVAVGLTVRFDLELEPLLAALPIGAAVLALLARSVSGPGRPIGLLSHRWTVRAARGVAVLATGSAYGVLLTVALDVLSAPAQPWQATPGTPLDTVLRLVADIASASGHGYAVAGLLGAGVLLLAPRPVRWAGPGAVLVASGLFLAPFIGPLPVAAVVGALLSVAVLAALVARQVRLAPPSWLGVGPWRSVLIWRTALGLACSAICAAVLLAWTTRPLSVPVTLIAAVALVGLRGVVPVEYRAVLPVLTVLSASVAAGAVPAMLDTDQVYSLDPRVIGVTGALLGAVLAGVPAAARQRSIAGERAAGAITGMALASLPALDLVDLLDGAPPGWGAASALLVGASLLLVAMAAAVHPATAQSPAGVRPPLLGALIAPVALVITAIGPELVQPDPDWPAIRILASAALAFCGLIVGVIAAVTARRAAAPGEQQPDRRVPAAELGTLVPIALVGLVAVLGPLSDPLSGSTSGWSDGSDIARQAWIAPLLLGVGATALAMAPGRRQLAWLGWVLLATSNAFRLLAGGVEPGDWVEAYTLPPALALLAVSALRLRLDRAGTSRGTLLPGLSLAVLPSVLAAPTGPWQRPAALIAVGAVTLAASRVVDVRVRWALAVAATAAAGGAGMLRAGHALVTEPEPAWQLLELWSVPAAVVVVAAGLIWMNSDDRTRSWVPLGPGVALLLGPSLLAAGDGEPVWRVALLAVLAAATVIAGARRRMQAPVVIGAAVLALHAVVQLAPWVARVVAGQPRWLSLAIVGAVLLGLGATYERRLRELRAVRLRVSALR